MKIIKYSLCTTVDVSTTGTPVWENILFPVEMGWNETNEEIAKREAYNGEYVIVEVPDVEPVTPTQEERITDLEEALALLLSGVTE